MRATDGEMLVSGATADLDAEALSVLYDEEGDDVDDER